jgi:tetratricopeptide (TPR) repeat protein
LELSPRKQSIIYDIATTKLNLGQKEEAVNLLKETYESSLQDSGTSSFDPKSRLSYAMALVFTDKEADAKAKFGNDPEIFMTKEMANLYVSRQEHDKAIAIYKYLAEKDPEDINARLQVVQALYIASKISEAVDTLRIIKNDFPEYTEKIEQIITEVEKGPKK